ncbi:MAG: tyrosine-type recombinase/integrase [Nitrospinae bacterium]|nr:tyrosine-type recombinase/integrase [Nitrospinota bacterium]
MRYDFFSKLVQRGVDLYSVAALAGHRDIKTTQRYAHLSPEKLKSAISVLNSGQKVGHNLVHNG